jgi:hypothetical protein
MPRPTSRLVACVALAWASFVVADGAKASVGGLSGGALSSFGRSPLVQTVQAGECWNENGPDGPGYYPCDAGASGGSVVGPGIGRPERRDLGGVNSAAPASPGLAGVHGPGEAAGAHIGAPSSRGLPGSAGVHGPGEAAGAHVGAPASPVVPRATASIPHIASPASPGPAGVGAVHASGPAVAAAPHIVAPASPGLAGVRGVGGGGGVGHR